ncbi:hypothetical protein B0H13DRAFT_2102267 [Mycena leptocephala]|nr:hypothetical protein B0H13DRAFT_2102267 [Mycena leptocephala]
MSKFFRQHLSRLRSPVVPATVRANVVPGPAEKLKLGFILLAKHAERFLDGTPFKAPIAVLNSCIDLAQTVSDNRSAIEALFEQTYHRLDLVNDALLRAGSEDAAHRVSKLARVLIREAQGLEAMVTRSTIANILLGKEDIQTIVTATARIHGYLADFHLDVAMAIERSTYNMMDQLNAMRIEAWPRSKHATYNADTEGIPLLKREACTPDTRISILGRIKQWAEDPSPDASQIFWLSGHAGSGKSTIAFSISQHYCTTSDLLAANFFCSRAFEDTRCRRYIIPSIVYQLARQSTSFRYALASTAQLWDDYAPEEQLGALLLAWKKCLDDRKFQLPSFLIVIDGLDEIEDGGGPGFLNDLLHAISARSLLGLRFLVTSRPNPLISDVFHNHPMMVSCRLQEVDSAEVEKDVVTFLHAKLPALEDKPQLKTLVGRCGDLFIFAATAVRYIRPRQKMTAAEQLDLLTKFLTAAPNCRFSPNRSFYRSTYSPVIAYPEPGLLDLLYAQILSSAFSGLHYDLLTHRLRILHAILSIPTPSTARAIARLDYAFTEELVELVVSELHAVLYVKADGTICWYHASLLEFIFDPDRSSHLAVENTYAHGRDMHCTPNSRLEFMLRMARQCPKSMPKSEAVAVVGKTLNDVHRPNQFVSLPNKLVEHAKSILSPFLSVQNGISKN